MRRSLKYGGELEAFLISHGKILLIRGENIATKKQVLLFLAGAETFHALAHLFFLVTGQSFHAFGFMIGQTWNAVAFIINALIAMGLLYWESNIKK